MQNQAYSNAMTMMCETLVRSSTIRYMISHNQKNLVSMTLAYEESNGFMMVRSLVKTLEKREQEASKYATLADFMPEIIDAINNFDPDDSSNQGGTAEPDTLTKDYVDLGIEMSDGKKLYFATRNVGETSPGGIETYFYRWGRLLKEDRPGLRNILIMVGLPVINWMQHTTLPLLNGEVIGIHLVSKNGISW